MDTQNHLHHYHQVFEGIATTKDGQITEELTRLKKLDKKLPSSNNFFIFVDMSTQELLYVSQNFSFSTGHPMESIQEEGLPFFLSLIHPDDLQIWVTVLEDLMAYTLEKLTTQNKKKLSYTYNYRIRNAEGIYLNIIENQIPTHFDKDGKPLISLGHFSIYDKEKDLPIRSEIKQLNTHNFYETVYTKTYQKGIFKELSNREQDIISLIAQGNNTKTIATTLSISVKTVENHRANICKKLKLPSQNNSLLNFALSHKAEIECFSTKNEG